MKNYKYTAFAKINAETLKSIYDDLENHPATLESVLTELKNTYSIFDLSLSTSLKIYSLSFPESNKTFDTLDFINLFKQL